MKNIGLILIIFIISNSCQKFSQHEDKQTNLLTDLKELCALNKVDLISSYSDKCLTPNQFGIVSEKVTESFEEFHKAILANEIKSNDFGSVIADLIRSKLPSELTDLSEEGFTEMEGEIYSLIVESLSKDDMETFNFRIACIEDLISRTLSLHPMVETRILIYCAALKSTINYIDQVQTEIKGESWDDCFRGKQLEKLNSGLFEKLRCVAIWPECLGVMAADCLIEQIF